MVLYFGDQVDSNSSTRGYESGALLLDHTVAQEALYFLFVIQNCSYSDLRKKEETDLLAKVDRQQKREEKRKRKALTKFRKQEEDKVSMKIAREEQKLIKAQRQLESIRLLDELFDRIKVGDKSTR